jgi:hypothetical protein
MPLRRVPLLLLPVLLGGCPLESVVGAVNQIALTPEIGTFHHVDCDGSDTLTLAEASARVFMRTSAVPTLHQVTAAEFAAGDADKDGRWTFQEFGSTLSGATAWSVSPNGCDPGLAPVAGR